MKKIKGCLNSINLKNIFKNFLWKNKKLTTTAYSWYDNHSTSTLRDARARTEVQVFKRELYTHIHLDYARVEFLSCIKIIIKKVTFFFIQFLP